MMMMMMLMMMIVKNVSVTVARKRETLVRISGGSGSIALRAHPLVIVVVVWPRALCETHTQTLQ